MTVTGPPWQTTSPASDDAGCAGGAGRRESKCPWPKRSAATRQSLIRSCELVWGGDLIWHAVSPVGGSDTFRRCSGKKPSPRARRYGKVDNHPKRYSLILSSTRVLRELVRNQSPLHLFYFWPISSPLLYSQLLMSGRLVWKSSIATLACRADWQVWLKVVRSTPQARCAS